MDLGYHVLGFDGRCTCKITESEQHQWIIIPEATGGGMGGMPTVVPWTLGGTRGRKEAKKNKR